MKVLVVALLDILHLSVLVPQTTSLSIGTNHQLPLSHQVQLTLLHHLPILLPLQPTTIHHQHTNHPHLSTVQVITLETLEQLLPTEGSESECLMLVG